MSEFFKKYPKVTDKVIHFTRTDINRNLIEAWKRNEQGEMIEVTQEDILRNEIKAVNDELLSLQYKSHERIMFPICPDNCPNYFTRLTNDGIICICTKLKRRYDSTDKHAISCNCPLTKMEKYKMLKEEEYYKNDNQCLPT